MMIMALRRLRGGGAGGFVVEGVEGADLHGMVAMALSWLRGEGRKGWRASVYGAEVREKAEERAGDEKNGGHLGCRVGFKGRDEFA